MRWKLSERQSADTWVQTLARQFGMLSSIKLIRRNNSFCGGIVTKFLVCLGSILVIFLASMLTARAQTDIFAPPVQTEKQAPGMYPTARALFDATRTGEVIDIMRGDNFTNQNNIGKSVLQILHKEYGFNPDRMLGAEWSHGEVFTSLMRDLTRYQFDEGKKEIAERFQRLLNDAFGGPNTPGSYRFDDRKFDDSKAIFNKFAGQYTSIVKEYVAAKRQQEERRKADLAEQQHRADLEQRKVAEERRQQKELANAQQASRKAQDDIKDAAMKDALAKAKQAREQKLAEVLSSPTYKLWEAALQVQQGQELVATAQQVLEHDSAVGQVSGVTDLAARRAAGERMVAGKTLVENAFAAYKKLGGKAVTPQEVVPGPDPAAEYR